MFIISSKKRKKKLYKVNIVATSAKLIFCLAKKFACLAVFSVKQFYEIGPCSSYILCFSQYQHLILLNKSNKVEIKTEFFKFVLI